MKILKYVLSVFFLLGGIGFISQENSISGLISLMLGVILLPKVSEKIKSKFQFWQSKVLRYTLYIGLFLLSGIFMKKENITNSVVYKVNKDEINENIKQSKNENNEKVIVFNGTGEKIGERIIDEEQKYKDEVENQFREDNSDFWSKYDPIVKRRIYNLIKNKDCKELQNEFNITADNLDRIQNSGGSGNRNLELMDFLNEKMNELGCYK